MKFTYGSLSEAIAILSYTRERNTTFMSAIFPVVSESKAENAVKQFRGIVFPEESLSDAVYLKKAKDLMKRLINTSIQIRPIKISGIMK
jgi:hypothetical protein